VVSRRPLCPAARNCSRSRAPAEDRSAAAEATSASISCVALREVTLEEPSLPGFVSDGSARRRRDLSADVFLPDLLGTRTVGRQRARQLDGLCFLAVRRPWGQQLRHSDVEQLGDVVGGNQDVGRLESRCTTRWRWAQRTASSPIPGDGVQVLFGGGGRLPSELPVVDFKARFVARDDGTARVHMEVGVGTPDDGHSILGALGGAAVQCVLGRESARSFPAARSSIRLEDRRLAAKRGSTVFDRCAHVQQRGLVEFASD
jgi:hypothetical protein